MRSFTVAALLTAAVVPGHIAAASPCQSGSNSTIPAPLVACPSGDVVSDLVVRSIYQYPCSYTAVVLAVGACPSFRHAPVLGDEGYAAVFDPGGELQYLWNTTDAAGRVGFALRGGGTCPAGGVNVYADGFLLASRALASPDQNGSLGVSAEDVELAEAKLGTSDPTADFDGDGTVTSADLDLLRGHLGHHAGMATPVASRSWGTLKLLYR